MTRQGAGPRRELSLVGRSALNSDVDLQVHRAGVSQWNQWGSLHVAQLRRSCPPVVSCSESPEARTWIVHSPLSMRYSTRPPVHRRRHECPRAWVQTDELARESLEVHARDGGAGHLLALVDVGPQNSELGVAGGPPGGKQVFLPVASVLLGRAGEVNLECDDIAPLCPWLSGVGREVD